MMTAAVKKIWQHLRQAEGDLQAFRATVVLPLLAVHVVLIILATVQGNSALHISLKLLNFAVILASILWLKSRHRQSFDGVIVCALLWGIALNFAIASLVFNFGGAQQFFLPLTLIVLSLFLAEISLTLSITLTVGLHTIVLFWVVAEMATGSLTALGIAPMFFLFASVMLVALALVRTPQQESLPIDETSVVNQPTNQQGDNLTQEILQREQEQLFNVAIRVIADEMRSEYAWRLMVIVFVSAALSMAGAFFFGMNQETFALCWVVLAALQMTLMREFAESSHKKDITLHALVVVVFALLWWVLLVFFCPQAKMFSATYLVLMMCLIGSMPLPPSATTFLAGLLMALIVGGATYQQLAVPQFCLPLLMIPVFVRMTAASHFAVINRAAFYALGRYHESSFSLVASLRLWAWLSALLCGAARSMIVFDYRRFELIGQNALQASDKRQEMLPSLRRTIDGLGLREGIMRLSRIGEDLHSSMLDWFGEVPSRLIFVKLTTVREQGEEQIALLVPMSALSRWIGQIKVLRSVVALTSVLRIALGASRSQVLHSDVLRHSEKLTELREGEINEVVHTVNNLAQDVAIDLASLSDQVSVKSDAYQRRLVGELEASAQAIAWAVSDLKLVKELRLMQGYSCSTQTDLTLLLDEFERFAQFESERRERKLRVQRAQASDLTVELISPELFSALLRQLMRRVADISQRGSEIHFQIVRQSEYVRSNIVFTPLSTANFAVDDFEEFKLANKFCELSKGSFVVEGHESNQINLSIILLAHDKLKQTIAQSSWVLFVDDSPQITMLYLRLAEALGVEGIAVASVSEARKELETRGLPRLVVTDISLGDESGIVLIKHLRDNFGETIPVIVVSGSPPPELTNTPYPRVSVLMKPVSRQRLCDEIVSALSKGEEG